MQQRTEQDARFIALIVERQWNGESPPGANRVSANRGRPADRRASSVGFGYARNELASPIGRRDGDTPPVRHRRDRHPARIISKTTSDDLFVRVRL
jgi:hypothetical protein